MNDAVRILGADGLPLTPNAPPKAKAIAGSGWRNSTPYDAANNYSSTMGDWQPWLWSPDGEINLFRDRIVSRARDIVRNDGWASGAITHQLDNIVGANFRPMCKPDNESLAHYTVNKAFDHMWAEEFGKALEANYRTWANDTNYYADSQRCLTVSQIFHLAFRHKLIDGDALALMLYLRDRVGPGKSHYATVVQLIDPDRLSNPQITFDNKIMRGGVNVDHLGAPIGYWIRRAHFGDWFNAGDSMTWDYIERETAWGRPLVVHDYDHDRAAQHRGGVGLLTPVLERMKMLTQYDGTELNAAVLNAVFSAYVTSPFDPQIVQSALGSNDELGAYQEMRSDFHRKNNMALGGVRMPILVPGEKIETVKSERPNANYPEFQKTFLRNIAAATGTSYEQISRDWSNTNYSSARAAILETWKTFGRRRHDFAVGFCQPIFAAFAEESFNFDNLPLPAGAPDFPEMRSAYSKAQWIGPGRGWVDPVKERQGAMLGMEAGLGTLEKECAENGSDWRENIAQRAREMAEFERLGIPLPSQFQEGQVIQSEKVG